MISTCAHLLVSVVVNRKDLECTEAGCRPAGPLPSTHAHTYHTHTHSQMHGLSMHTLILHSHRHTLSMHKVPSCLTKSYYLAKAGCQFTKQAELQPPRARLETRIIHTLSHCRLAAETTPHQSAVDGTHYWLPSTIGQTPIFPLPFPANSKTNHYQPAVDDTHYRPAVEATHYRPATHYPSTPVWPSAEATLHSSPIPLVHSNQCYYHGNVLKSTYTVTGKCTIDD